MSELGFAPGRRRRAAVSTPNPPPSASSMVLLPVSRELPSSPGTGDAGVTGQWLREPRGCWEAKASQ